MSSCLLAHRLQHVRLLCCSISPGVCSNSNPLSQWCYLTISSSATPFSAFNFFPSIRVFSNESAPAIRWPKYWSFSFSIRPSNEYSGLISFRIDLFDVLAVQRTLKNLLQHHSLKASVLWCSALFMSQPYLTTGKTIALNRQTFVGKMSSLFFNTLSTYHNFPSKEQVSFIFSAAVTVCSDFGAQENKICHYFHFPPIYLPWSDGTGCPDLSVVNVEF